jgi:hypothetical protein
MVSLQMILITKREIRLDWRISAVLAVPALWYSAADPAEEEL